MEKKGVLSHYSQSGSGQLAWCFQDERFIEGEYFDPEGRYELAFGDRLTIFQKDNPDKVLWEGIINSDDMRKHALTNMLDPALWFHWFDRGYPATLVRK